MSDSPDPPTKPHPPTGKRKRSASGWAAHKAPDARCQAEHYEGKQALASPSYTLGTMDDLQLQVYLAPLVPEKHSATAFERFRGRLVRCLRAKWLAATVVRVDRDKPQGHHWASDLWRLQLGGTRCPDPFLSVTSSMFATTQQRPILRGKIRVIGEVREQLFPNTAAQAPPANPAQARQVPR